MNSLTLVMIETYFFNLWFYLYSQIHQLNNQFHDGSINRYMDHHLSINDDLFL